MELRAAVEVLSLPFESTTNRCRNAALRKMQYYQAVC